jgi:uncharacterized membrane protein
VWIVAISTLVSAVMMTGSYLFKARCLGPEFDARGISGPDLGGRLARWVCYTDLQALWSLRQLWSHPAPYSGSLTSTGELTVGTLEYPVLSGVFLWLAALLSSTDAQFVIRCAVGVGICGLLTSLVLARLTGWRSLWWSLAPGLVLYTVYNVDLLAVAASVAAIGVVLSAGTGNRRRKLLFGAVLLAVGGACKLYPLMFVAPIALWISLGVEEGRSDEPARRPDRAGAVLFIAVAAAAFAVLNLPFAVRNVQGWWAAFAFQAQRPINETTNSIWYWALRPISDGDNAQSVMAIASTAATAVSLLAVCLVGLHRRGGGEYPWIQVSGAMLCAYLLFNKVHSPQFVLWLIPFFVLIRVPWKWIVAYYVADACMGIGFFRRVAAGTNSIQESIWPQVVVLGVWGRAILLVAFIGIFLRADTTVRQSHTRRREAALWPTNPEPSPTDSDAPDNAGTHPGSRSDAHAVSG